MAEIGTKLCCAQHPLLASARGYPLYLNDGMLVLSLSWTCSSEVLRVLLSHAGLERPWTKLASKGVQKGIQLSVEEMRPFMWPTPLRQALHPPTLSPSSGHTQVCLIIARLQDKNKESVGNHQRGTQEDKAFLVQNQKLWHSHFFVF